MSASYKLHIRIPINYITNHEEGRENSEVDNRQMRREPVGKGKLTHIWNILYNLVYTMAEHYGDHWEEGEEEAGPVVDVNK